METSSVQQFNKEFEEKLEMHNELSIFEKLEMIPDSKDILTRPGPGGTSLSYYPTYLAIEKMNKILGPHCWKDEIVNIKQEVCEQVNGIWTVGYSCRVVVTWLFEGKEIRHEDIGYGDMTSKKLSDAIGNAQKAAVSDAKKRAIRYFGTALGNKLSDKGFIKEVKKNNTKVSNNNIGMKPVYQPANNLKPGNQFKFEPQKEKSLIPPVQKTIQKKQFNGYNNSIRDVKNDKKNEEMKPVIQKMPWISSKQKQLHDDLFLVQDEKVIKSSLEDEPSKPTENKKNEIANNSNSEEDNANSSNNNNIMNVSTDDEYKDVFDIDIDVDDIVDKHHKNNKDETEVVSE